MAVPDFLPLLINPKTLAQKRQNWFRAGRNALNWHDILAELFGFLVHAAVVDQTMTAGQLVYASSAGNVDLAIATSEAASDVVGAVRANTSSGAAGEVQTVGVLEGLSGLTAGTVYYLSPTTAGAITATAPATAGQYVVRVGVALAATELLLNIEPGILL